jgi:regulator of protease activity HflC (stomatin/prohibitin superfamily)
MYNFKKKEMKGIRFIGPWGLLAFLVAIISLILLVLLTIFINFVVALIVAIMTFFVIMVPIFLNGWNFVRDCPIGDLDGNSLMAIPKNYALMLNYNGEYIGEPLYEGQYVIFPLFGLYKVEAIIHLASSQVKVFDNTVDNRVDFKGGATVKVDAVINFRIAQDNLKENIEKYTFERDADKMINSKISTLLRSHLGSLEVEEAHVGEVTLEELRSVPDAENLFDKILSVYGVEITSVNIEDIELSEEIIKSNMKKIQARNELAAAESDAKKMELLANARATALKIESEALSKQVEFLLKSGGKDLSPDMVLAYLAETEKWKSMKASDKAVVIDNGKSVAGMLSALKTLNV